jgi:hypothetical protein
MVDWHLGAGGAWVFRSAEHGGGSAVDLLAVANSRNNFVIGFAGLFETIFSGLKGEELGRGGRKEGLTVCSDGAVPLLFEAWIMTYLLSPFCIRAAAVFLYCALTESFTTGPIVGERSLLVVAASRFHAITSADCSSATCCWISISQRCCLSFASWHWASRISVSSSSVGLGLRSVRLEHFGRARPLLTNWRSSFGGGMGDFGLSVFQHYRTDGSLFWIYF